MELGLTGKIAVVFGASGGLGRAMAVALGQEGAHVALCARNKAELEKTRAIITDAGGKAAVFEWDLAELDKAQERFARIEAELGPVDILINNTGGPPPSPAAGQDINVWRKHFDSMVASVIAITDLALPGMRKRGFGRILTSTSSGIVAPIPNLAISNTLRLALAGWSKTLSREVAADGITVNLLVPGRIATGRVAALDAAKASREGRTAEEVTAESIAAIPARRYGRPEEYGAVAAFLASECAAYITGATIRVDGGLIPSL